MSPRVVPITLHEPPVTEYRWVFANGHLQVSPDHTHQDLLGHAQIPEDHDGPIAMGEVEVQAGLAGWSVMGNVSLRYLSKILMDYTKRVGWRWGGLLDHLDQTPIDQFGPKKSTMYWWYPSEGEQLKLSRKGYPDPNQVGHSGYFDYDDNEIHLYRGWAKHGEVHQAIQEFANDTNRKLAEYPGGGEHLDLTNKLKNNAPANEDYELENLGDNKGQDPRKPDDDDPGEGPWVSRDGAVFHDWGEFLIHVQELNGLTDDFEENGKFPKAPDMDKPLPNNWNPRQPFIMPLAFRQAAPKPKDQLKDPVPFIYDIDADKLAVGHPGTRHSDIPGKFTPGGIVEGTYEPGGKVIVRTMTNMPWTTRHMIDLWYWSYPQMEVTGVELEDAEGKTTRLASDRLEDMKTHTSSEPDVGQTLRANLLSDPAAHLASQALQGAGGKVFIVGGAVRDVLLGKQPNDIDLMVTGLSPDQVDLVLSRLPGRMDLTGKHFGVYRYTQKGHEVEVALPRVESSTGDTQKDFDTQISGDIPVEKDLGRRDFTANAMAFDLQTGEIVDPHGGAEDLRNGVLKPVFPDTFKEDPTRLLRALTAHTRHGLEPDQDTIDQMSRDSDRIVNEPKERIQKELDKILSNPNPHHAIELALRTGLLKHVFPEVYDHWDFDQKNPHHNQALGPHLKSVLENVSKTSEDKDLRLAALLHDIGKPGSQWIDDQGVAHYYRSKEGQGDDHARLGAEMAEQRLRDLKYPTARIDRIKHLINNHMYPAFSSEKGARKFLNRVGDQHADDLMLLRNADQYGKGQPWVEPEMHGQQTLVQKVRETGQPQGIRDLAVSGRDILGLGVPAGPQVGEVLNHLTNRVIDDPQMNEKQPLLDAAREYLNV